LVQEFYAFQYFYHSFVAISVAKVMTPHGDFSQEFAAFVTLHVKWFTSKRS
jgi:hypothetical protein